MSRFARKNCLVLATAAVLAVACATENPSPDTAAAPAAQPGTVPGAQSSSTTRQAPAARAAGSSQAAAPAGPVVPKSMPGQRSVYFDYDRHDIKPEFQPAIEAHARFLREHSNAKMTIEGNGDERGSREYNLALGQRRAESVRQMMRLLGAADHQIEAVSFGEEKPKANGHDEASWAQNRRSDFVYRRGD